MAEQIEWRFPEGELRRLRIPLVVITIGIAIILVPGNLFMWHTKRHITFLDLSLVILLLHTILLVLLPLTFRSASRARYFIDEVGLHIQPGVTYRWAELRGLRVIDWPWSPGRRVISIVAKNPLRSRVLAFDPATLREDEFLGFTASHMSGGSVLRRED